jgi:hypothetical protein
METKNFFSKIRAIIREEIEYALEKNMSDKSKNKTDVSAINHVMTIYKEQQSSNKAVKPKQKTQKTEFGSIQELLAETKRSLQESSEMENEFRFTADMAEGFGYERGATPIPQGYSQAEVPAEVMTALTRDYSALMKKIDEKKGR